MEGGGGYVHLGKFLLRCGTSGADIWGGDLGDVGCNVGKIEGVHVGLLRQVTGNNARRKKDGSWRRAESGRVIQ